VVGHGTLAIQEPRTGRGRLLVTRQTDPTSAPCDRVSSRHVDDLNDDLDDPDEERSRACVYRFRQRGISQTREAFGIGFSVGKTVSDAARRSDLSCCHGEEAGTAAATGRPEKYV